jgi:hypothetical protein
MKKTSRTVQAVTSDSDDYLDTDDEINEFEHGMQLDVDEDDDDQGVAQWEPDSWDMAAEDEEDEDEDEDDTMQKRERFARLEALSDKIRPVLRALINFGKGSK